MAMIVRGVATKGIEYGSAACRQSLTGGAHVP
jgi:hypothetical protein